MAKIKLVKNAMFGTISKGGYRQYIFVALGIGSNGFVLSFLWWVLIYNKK